MTGTEPDAPGLDERLRPPAEPDYHVFDDDLSCMECRQPWPCATFKATLRRIYHGDAAGMVEFMTSFLPIATYAGLDLPRDQIYLRLVGWCTGTPQLSAPLSVAGCPVPAPEPANPRRPGRPATPSTAPIARAVVPTRARRLVACRPPLHPTNH